MFNFFKQGRSAFGLDISDLSVKMIQLEKNAKGYKIAGYVDHPVQKGVMANDIILDENLLVRNIKTAMAKMDFGKLKTELIVASIPESKAFVRIIQIPKMSEEQADAAVSIEAEQY